MISLASLIGDNLAAFLPLRFVRSFEQGVREKRGVALYTLPPGGPYLHIPGFWEVELVDAARRSVNLPALSITTADDTAVTVSPAAPYSVVDAVKMYSVVLDLEETLADHLAIYTARVIRAHTWPEIVENQDGIEREILRKMRAMAKKWGVEVHDVGLPDLVQARQYRLFGDGVTGGG